MSCSFCRGTDTQGLSAGGDRCREGARRIVGGRPVTGDRPNTIGTPTLDAGGKLGVNPGALTWQEPVIEHLASQLMTEPHLLAVDDEQRPLEQPVEHVAQGVEVKPADVGQHTGCRRPGGCDHAEHLLCGVVEHRCAGEDCVAQCRRQPGET